jgi:hypothetical protein
MKGTTNIGDPGYREVLRDNIISWLDSAMLKIGGYIDVTNQVTAYGQRNEMYPLNGSDTTFFSRRGNWVWEPDYGINISGVYIDGALQTSGYSINYRDGIVEFDSPVSGTVTIDHTEKYVEVFNAQDNDFYRVDDSSFEVSDGYFLTGSGTIHPSDKVQLPAIAVEVVNRDSRTPYEIGNTSHYRRTDVLIRVMANDDGISSRLSDFLTDQKETSIRLFDTKQVAQSGYYPLNYDGTVNFASGYYDNLIENFPYNNIKNSKVFIKDAFSEDLNYITPNLCKVTVRLNIESITR